ncbi:hypothetical protein [Actinomycetospora termitidis]|uniref:Uncharacterized protein n=1 Tax=Actinomycetospora termitidis TaxID=3053470 RepID=A0ABT7MI45_9PSEU|nr:hypothetical protein [Actinomycetospora sp. Odt1-22]MDL5160353.1 hypothetical protein [Actinomycetospora sp. Odt1-22]
MTELEHELRDIWTNVCLTTQLAQVIPPPGAKLQVPTIGRITLDSVPARFTVRLRAGQLPVDVARRAARLAAAFRVPEVEIVPLTTSGEWISVRLLEPYWIEWPDEYVLEAGDDRPVVDAVQDRDALPVGEGVRVVDAEPVPTTTWGSVRRFLGDFWRLPDGPDPVGPARP